MPRVLAISGSLRKESHNTALLRALPGLMPPGMHLEFFGDLAGVPLYNADLDGPEAPAEVTRLRREVTESDGLIIATPEYLHTIPGVVKNAIDWLSRPIIAPALSGKAIVLLVATTGRASGFRTLAVTAEILTGLRNVVIPRPEVVINNAHEVLTIGPDGEAEVTDPVARGLIGVQLAILGDLLEAGSARLLESSFRQHTAAFYAHRP